MSRHCPNQGKESSSPPGARQMTTETPPTAYKALAAELREAILAGKFPANHQLPTEAELVASSGLSRQTVRHAFRELESESLVYRIRGRGTFAAPVSEGA